MLHHPLAYTCCAKSSTSHQTCSMCTCCSSLTSFPRHVAHTAHHLSFPTHLAGILFFLFPSPGAQTLPPCLLAAHTRTRQGKCQGGDTIWQLVWVAGGPGAPLTFHCLRESLPEGVCLRGRQAPKIQDSVV